MLPIGTNSSSKDKNWFTHLRPAGNVNTYAIALAKNSGNIYSTAPTQSSTVLGTSFAKFDKDGICQWQKYLGYQLSSPYSAVAVDSSEYVYVFAASPFNGFSGELSNITKFDSNGNPIWCRALSLDTSTKIYPRSLCMSNDGNYFYCAGYYNSNAYIAKYDLNGNLIMQKSFSLASTATSVEICIDSANNIYLTAGTASGVTVVKIDSSHSLLWQRYIAGINVFDMTCDINNNLYLASYTFEPSGTGYNALTMTAVMIKYSSAGNLLWQKKIIQTPQPQYIGAGFTSVRVSADGNNVYGNLATGYGMQLPQPSGGTLFGAPGGTIAGDAAIINFDSDGNYKWSRTFSLKPTATRRSLSYKMEIDKNDNLYATTTGFMNPTPLRWCHGIFKFDAKIQHNDSTIDVPSTPVTPQVLQKDGQASFTFSGSDSTYSESAGSGTYSNGILTSSVVNNPEAYITVGSDTKYRVFI